MPSVPGLDPNMTQAYFAAMFQMMAAQQSAGGMGLPPMPFPGMPSPYTAPTAVSDATVAVSVEGMKFQYQLTEDDLHKVFGRYGSVKQIRVDDAGAGAHISFVNTKDAQSAMNDLNGKVLNGLEGTLRISWVNQGQNQLPGMAPPFPGMGFPGMGFPGMGYPGMGYPGGAATAAGQQSALTGGGASAAQGGNVKGVRKYTCRFIIGIENDKEFQVARRVIGAKGSNMKKIVKNTEAKLRLRGQGSGYFEGAGQKESAEPLQLCVSCTNGEEYKQIVTETENLLKKVYDEYRAFCRDTGKPIPDLQVQFSENQLVYSGAQQGMAEIAGDATSPKRDRKARRPVKGAPVAPTGEDDRGEPGPNAPPVDEIEKMIDMRNEARRACNFTEADRLRDSLHASGVALMDEPGGRGRGAEVTTWRYWRD